MTKHTEVLIVGGGPAGMAAATAAAQADTQVTVLDDNPNPGGQIWRPGLEPEAQTGFQRTSLRDFRQSGATLLAGRRIVDAPRPGMLRAFVEATDSVESFIWSKLILATGARERFLPFPGWTLPGVFGAGGLQALVKGGYSVQGKRVVVAGTGPLLLAVAAHLRQDGAAIVSLAEQAGMRQLLPFAASLWSEPRKLLQGAGLRASLTRMPYRTGTWVIAAEGQDKLEAVQLTDGASSWTEPCDLLACGFHLVPNTELPTLLGCSLHDSFVQVNADQQTTVANIFCAGEPTGIAGLDSALVEGAIAGLNAAGRQEEATRLHPRRDRERAFGQRLSRAFSLRPELSHLARPETIVCRCEDVRYSQLQQHTSWTEAKLQTRCGMGPCQGRICGPAAETLFGWHNTSIRPPLFPIPLSALAETLSPPASSVLQETP